MSSSPVGTAERAAHSHSAVPYGTGALCIKPYPALKCWAIVNSPSGAKLLHNDPDPETLLTMDDLTQRIVVLVWPCLGKTGTNRDAESQLLTG